MTLLASRGFIRRVSPMFLFAFAEALDEADGGADEIEFGAQLIFEKPLVAEVQRRFLIGEDQKCRRPIFAWVM